MRCDTTRREDLEKVAAAAQELGTLTCWVNNAGVASARDNAADALTSRASRAPFGVNFQGAFRAFVYQVNNVLTCLSFI